MYQTGYKSNPSTSYGGGHWSGHEKAGALKCYRIFFFFFLRLIWTDCATEQFFRTQAVKKWSLSCCCRINQTGGSLSISTSINEAFFGVIPHRMGYDFVSVKLLYQKESLKRKGFASNSTQLLFYYHFSDTHAMLLPEGKKQALIGSVLLLSQWKQSF